MSITKQCSVCFKDFSSRNRNGRKSPTSQFCSRQCYWQSMTVLLTCQELWDIDNGRTLCSNCHRKTDTWGYHGMNKQSTHNKEISLL